MKLLPLICLLVLVGAAFTAQTGSKSSASSGGAGATRNPRSATTNQTPSNSKTVVRDGGHGKKREIPDALVDHPEDFESSPEDETPVVNHRHDSPDGEVDDEDDTDDVEDGIVENLDEGSCPEVNEDPTYEERKKRTAELFSARNKRKMEAHGIPQAKPKEENERPKRDEARVREIIRKLKNGEFTLPVLDIPDLGDEALEAEYADRAANELFESLGFGPNAATYWPNGPPGVEKMIPVAKIRIPIV